MSYAISKISRNSSFLGGEEIQKKNIMSDFKFFQEFFISLGWGGHTSIHCELCDFENFYEFFISEGWGGDTKIHCELCDF